MFFPTLLIAAMATGAESSPQDELDRKPLVVSTAGGRIEFSSENGGILAVRQKGGTGSIVISGEHGLWQVRFQDGSTLDAAGFAAGNKDREFSVDTDPTGQKLRLNYRSAAIQVTVSVIGTEDGVDLVGQVRPAEKTILDFALPARLRFDPGQVNRVVVPSSGNSSVGMAFRGSFFQRQSVDDAAAWQGKSVGPQGYVGLYGGYLTMRPMDDPPVPLRVTATGREWLGDSAAKRLEGSRATVNRPPGRGQADLVLVDSDKGAYFSAHRLGGTGALWRIGGFVHEKEAPLSRGLVTAALRKLVSTAPATRRKLGVVALARGPERGAGNHVAARDWLGEVRRTAAALNVVELGNVRELTAALAADNFLAIVNPYGELIPAEDEAGLAPMITAIGRFVRGGGNWFEVGGYSFFGVLRPVRYFDYHLGYPPAFADFLHVDTHTGKLAVFGVQPQHTTPWIGVTDRAAIFVPGRLGCGGDERGGYGDRTFGAFVKPGETWRAPASHLLVGQAAPESLLTYCTLNGITRKLDEKMSPAQLAKFRQAVLVFYTGNCAEMLAHVDKLPVPTLVHFSEYLKGGFDKEYPDHLPPQVRFGTPAEFRRFFDLCHTLGHLVMPYTNPTWWCDHPRGPTFQQAGEAPLLRTLDGKLSYERYSLNDGYTVCHWHPAVQKANRETVRQFTEDYPVDVLFQDQCGARSWHYDTNPASPTPLAYMDGLLSMVAEDCRRVPLSTESGWDRVVNFESQLCGLSWQLVPTEGGPEWRRYLKHMYPPKAWDIFPVAQFIAHDKTVLVHHDLGQFVTNPEVLAWTLGLGFSLSYRCPAASLEQDSPREWLRWLDRLQKSVCSRYIGQPLLTFEHDRGPRPTIADDGLLRATYGGSVPIKVVANLGSAARVEKEKHLAPHGFYTTAPGLVAGRLQRVGNVDIADDGVSFVMEGDAGKADLWIYSQADREVAVEIPQGMTGDVTVTFDKAEPRKISAAKGVVRLKLPPAAGKPRVTVPAALA